mmetsp:Transcript_34620/g.83639  ORF Transcript_34620/g.83639 Transcript_34620/m.83639 type:complete len:449 (-) Transcript_34620:144-1490(-)
MASSENVAIAMGLVIAAGASTAIGAAVVFIPRLIKLASRRVLAASLGFSAGVMTYVSFVEIFGKATLGFEDAGHEPNVAYMFATLCFFSGVVIMILLNMIVAMMLGGHSHRHREDGADHDHNNKPHDENGRKATRKALDEKIQKMAEQQEEEHDHQHHDGHGHGHGHGHVEPTNECLCHASDPVEQLNTLQQMGSVLIHEQEGDVDDAEGSEPVEVSENSPSRSEDNNQQQQREEELAVKQEEKTQQLPVTAAKDTVVDNTSVNNQSSSKKASSDEEQQQQQQQEEEVTPEDDPHNKKLVKMGLNTAIAIGLHNFPEGLATFVAALEDPKVGAVLAVAIAIHNIPEGLCVALPIYYATGNRLKAFLWALLSGASEVVAALLGWAILANAFTDNAYATLFGLVAGMMVIISIRELLPTAHFYDPEDTVVTFSYIGGMALMALSLVLFQI